MNLSCEWCKRYFSKGLPVDGRFCSDKCKTAKDEAPKKPHVLSLAPLTGKRTCLVCRQADPTGYCNG